MTNLLSYPILFLFLGILVSLSSCGGGGGGGTKDTIPPLVVANPASGTYGSIQTVTLTSNENATIYYSLDGVDPIAGAANTISGTSPISGISISTGTTVLKFFAVDMAQNIAAVRQETYTVDLVAPTIALVGSAPTAVGLLTTTSIGWRSDKAGDYSVELGGTGTPGSGDLLATGLASANTQINQPISGAQLSYSAATPLWVYLTDSVGHLGSTSINLSLKPMVAIDVTGIGSGHIAVLPNGLMTYVARTDANTVDIIDSDPASPTFNTVLTSVAVGVRPSGIAATPDGSRVYVTNNGDTSLDIDSISVIATSTDTITDTITLGPNSAPSGIAITPDGTRAYFLRFENMISMLDINPTSSTYHSVTANIDRTLLLGGAIGITPDGTRAVVNWQGMSSNAVDILDVNPASSTYNTILFTPVGVIGAPGGDVAVTSDNNFAYITDTSHLLGRLNLQNSAISPTGPFAGASAFALTPDGTSILMGDPNSNNLTVMNTTDLTIDVEIPMGAGLGFSGSIAITPDGTGAYLVRDITSVNSQVVMVPLH